MTKQTVLMVMAVGILLGSVGATFAKQGDKDNDRGPLSKITFIHYKKGHARPPRPGGGKGDSGSYTYLAAGAKWKVLEGVVLNPACAENVDGGMDGLIQSALNASLGTWEGAGGQNLQIFGGVSVDGNVGYDDGAYRGFNTVSFGSYGDGDVIAVTTVWGYFGGKPATREITEAHILMNDGYQWGDASANSLLMDIQNIFTHELGHWAGMGDLYEVGAGEETMYGYSTEGETKKRDLYKGDVAGITGLY